MSLVTKKLPQIVILLDRQYLAIYAPQLSAIAQFPFAETWVRDLEIINLTELNSQLSLYLTKLALPPSECILILSKSIYFSQVISTEKPMEPAKDATPTAAPPPPVPVVPRQSNSSKELALQQEFARAVPFSNVFSATINLGKQRCIIALNRDLYDPVLKVLETHHLKVTTIFPDVAVPPLANQQLTPAAGKSIIESHQHWLESNLLHTQDEDSQAGMKMMPAKNAPERKRLMLMAVGLGVLFLIFGGFLAFTMQQNAANKLAIEAQRKALLAITASSSAQLSPSPTLTTVLPEASESGDIASEAAQLRIQILNGTGIAGRAAEVQEALELLQFTQVTTGNSATQNSGITLVVVKPSVSSAIRQQVLDLLSQLQFTARISESTEILEDIRITLALPVIQ